MRKSLVLLIPILLFTAFLLAGCGSGGDNRMTPGVTMTVGADATPPQIAMTRNGIGLTAPLDAGAVVTVYDFRTGVVIRTGTLDGSGFCDLENITTGLTVAIVVTGTRGGEAYRLSTLIANVPNIDTTIIINPVTSLAAEATALQYYKQNNIIDQAAFDLVLAAAQAYADSNPGADYSLEGGLITGSTFGVGSLNAGALAAVIAAVPADIDNDIVLAKNAVQQIKEAGFTLHQLLDLPPPDLQSIFTQTVSDNYSDLGNRLNLLMLPALFGFMDYYDGIDWTYGVSIIGLEVGKAYRVTANYGGYLEIEDDPANNTPGRVTLIDNTTGAKHTLISRQTSITTQQLTQTSDADNTLEYQITATLPPAGSEANPSASLSISLRDANFPTPLTYLGTISATGADLEHYTKVTYNGTLTTPQVTSSGILEVRFPSTVPSGAKPGAMIYDFPSSFAMTGANIVFHGPGYTITLSGDISVASMVVTGGDGFKTIVPRSFSLSGGYSDTQIDFDFSGALTANWENPAVESSPNTVDGTVGLEGNLSRAGFPEYSVDLDFILDSGQLSSTIHLQSGAYKLDGTGSGTLTAIGDLEDGTLILTNQAGVQFTLAADIFGEPVGDVTVNGTQVAAITGGEFGGIKIQYTDGTFDEF